MAPKNSDEATMRTGANMEAHMVLGPTRKPVLAMERRDPIVYGTAYRTGES